MTVLPPGGATARPVDASTGHFIRLAVPIMLAGLTEPLLGMVATTAVGRLGEAHLLGAAAIGAVFFDIVLWGLGSLRLSTAALSAQAHGSGDDVELARVVMRAFALALGLGVLFIAIQGPLIDIAIALMKPSDAVASAFTAYVRVRMWSAPFALANYAILGTLIGRGRTDLGLAVQIGINLVNIALTLLAVSGLGLGIVGAALATLGAEIIGAAGGLLLLLRIGAIRPVGRDALTDGAALRRMLVVNRDVAIRSLALLGSFAFFTAQGARAGDITLAANGVLHTIFLAGAFLLDGYATAAEQLCGQAVGARDGEGFRRSVRKAVVLSLASSVVVSLVAYGGGRLFIDVVAVNPDVRAAALAYLGFAALTPSMGALAFTFDGVFVGATWTVAMRNLMLVATALYLATFWLTTGWGNAGLWSAFLVFLAARGLGQAVAYPILLRRTEALR